MFLASGFRYETLGYMLRKCIGTNKGVREIFDYRLLLKVTASIFGHIGAIDRYIAANSLLSSGVQLRCKFG